MWVFTKAILMSTHYICFCVEIYNIIPKLSSNTHLICFSEKLITLHRCCRNLWGLGVCGDGWVCGWGGWVCGGGRVCGGWLGVGGGWVWGMAGCGGGLAGGVAGCVGEGRRWGRLGRYSFLQISQFCFFLQSISKLVMWPCHLGDSECLSTLEKFCETNWVV